MSITNGTTIYNGPKPMKTHRQYVKAKKERENAEENNRAIWSEVHRKGRNHSLCGSRKRRRRALVVLA